MKKIGYILFLISIFIFVDNIKAADSFTTSSTFSPCRPSDVTTAASGNVCVYSGTNSLRYFCLDNGKPLHGDRVYTYQEKISGTGVACAIMDAINSEKLTAPTNDGTVYYTSFDSNDDNFLIQESVWGYATSTKNCVSTTTTDLGTGTLAFTTGTVSLEKKLIGSDYYYTGSANLNYTSIASSTYQISTNNTNLIVSESENGSKVTSSNKKTLYFRIPYSKVTADTNVNITISSTYNDKKVVTLTPFIDSYSDNQAPTTNQRLGKLGITRSTSTQTGSVSNTLVAQIDKEETVTEISKQDITGGKELPGATLQILDKNNNNISCKIKNSAGEIQTLQKCEWVSTNKKTNIIGLATGKYYLKETVAPKGYNLVKNSVQFEVEDTGDVNKVTLKNEQTETQISKKSAVNGEELPGATLQILDKDGKDISCKIKDTDGNIKTLDKCEWVSTDKPISIIGLEKGKYYLKETISPEGFALAEGVVEFEVKADGSVNKVEMVNELEVEVPDTLSSKSALLLTIAMFDIALGIGIVIYVKKNKITE